MRYLISATLLVAGVIHLLPLSGMLGGKRLDRLYGLSFSEPNLAILMRHRAILFGLLGTLLVSAALVPTLQSVALIAGTVSAVSFLLLAKSIGSYNAQLKRVVATDEVAVLCLIVGSAAQIFIRVGH
jgi:hypothetical protein